MKALVEATLYRDAGAVKRYHVKRVLRTQTNAEHTFGVLMLLKQVTADEAWDPARLLELYEAALHHDLPELMTGDVPAPIKRVHPGLGPMMESIEEQLFPLYRNTYGMGPDDAALLKWADRMELVLWCLEEVRMGNTLAAGIVSRGLGWILVAHLPECAQALTDEVVADALTVGIAPATGAELEMNA